MQIIVPQTVTVNIYYRMPDYEDIIQQFVWQTDDVPPEMPRVKKFIEFWSAHIEAEIFQCEILTADETTQYKPVDFMFEVGCLN